MSPIETIVRPRRNRISVPVPKEYGSYSFQVILVPQRGPKQRYEEYKPYLKGVEFHEKR